MPGQPRIGAKVYYKLTDNDVHRIRQELGPKIAARLTAGDVIPATVTSTGDDTGTVDDNSGTVNLSVNLDGDDTYVVRSRQIGDTEGSYTTEE